MKKIKNNKKIRVQRSRMFFSIVLVFLFFCGGTFGVYKSDNKDGSVNIFSNNIFPGASIALASQNLDETLAKIESKNKSEESEIIKATLNIFNSTLSFFKGLFVGGKRIVTVSLGEIFEKENGDNENSKGTVLGEEDYGVILNTNNNSSLTETSQLSANTNEVGAGNLNIYQNKIAISNGSSCILADLVSSDYSLNINNENGVIDITSSLGNKVDISGETNLKAGSGLRLEGDSLRVASSIARDSELHNALTLSGEADYLTLVGQEIVRNLIDLNSHVTGVLSIANGGTGVSDGSPVFNNLSLNGTFSILESGLNPNYSTIFRGANQNENIIYTLPSDSPAGNNYVLTAQTDGTLAWSSVSGTGGVSGIGTAGQVAYWSDASTITGENYLSVSRGGTGANTLNDLIILGTHTIGNYVATISGNSQIGVSGAGAENSIASLLIIDDSIGNAQLAYDTGQNLTTASSPAFSGLTLSSLTGGSIPFIGTGGNLIQDNGNLFWDDVNRRLGIGTITPVTSLDVRGNVSIPQNNALFFSSIIAQSRILQDNLSTLQIYGASGLNFKTFSSSWMDRLTINSLGNVGIGTTSPNVKLDVRGNLQIGNSGIVGSTNWPLFISDSSGLGWKVADGSGNTKFELYAGGSGGINEMRIFNGVRLIGYGQDLTMGTSNYTSAMTIQNSTGNVGIGTTNPGALLDVSGSSGNLFRGQNGSTQVFSVGSTGNFWLKPSSAATVPFTITGALDQTGHLFDINSDGSTGGNLMTILSNGNVGIGTTTPASKLQILSATEQLRLSYNSTNYASFTVNNQGYISVGGTLGRFDSLNAYANLSFVSPGSIANTNTGGGTGMSIIGSGSTSGFLNLKSTSGNAIGDYVKITGGNNGGTEIARFLGSGNVGIGTTSPLEKLQVNGKILVNNGSLLYIDSNTGGSTWANSGALPMVFNTNSANQMVIGANGTVTLTQNLIVNGIGNTTIAGNVGIGTTSPGNHLHIQGTGNQFLEVESNNASTAALMFKNTVGEMYAGINGAGNFSIRNVQDILNGTLLTVKSTGNVGIGTTNPTAKLELYDPVNGGVNNAILKFNKGGQISEIYHNDTGARLTLKSSIVTILNDTVISAYFKPVGLIMGSGKSIFGENETSYLNLSEGGSGDFKLFANPDKNIRFGNGAIERMRIDAFGNVGIGLTNPAYKLDVLGDANVSGTLTVGTLTATNLSSASAISAPYFTATDALGTSSFAGGISISGNIIPTSDNTYSLGSATNMWKDVYIGPGSLYVNGKKVIQEASESMVFTADLNQNLIVQTSGSGDIELNPLDTGMIQLKGNVQLTAGKTFRTSTGAPINFSDGILGGNLSLAGNILSASNTNGSLELSANGLGAVYVTTGNFGIGTTGPLEKLDVDGRVHLAQTTVPSTVTDRLYNVGGNLYWNGVDVSGGGTGATQWTTSGTNIYYNGGNVGIGTSNPLTTLHVNKASSDGTPSITSVVSAVFQRSATPASQNDVVILAGSAGLARLTFGDKDSAFPGFITYDNSLNSLTFGTNAGIRLTIDNSGNVGIGTTSPSDLLHIFKSLHSAPLLLHIENDGYLEGASAGIKLTSKSTAGGASDALILNDADAATNSSRLLFQTGASTSPSTKMVIGGNGNVGIGTTSPGAKLDVVGGINVGSGESHLYQGAYFDPVGGVSAAVKISQNAGVTFPAAPFTAGINGTAIINYNTYAGYFNNASTVSGTGKNYGLYVIGNDNYFSGNVGIGTMSPSSKLTITTGNIGFDDGYGSVWGSTSIKGYSAAQVLAFNTGGSEAMRIINNGNVGIGTTTPGEKLDVSGNVRINASESALILTGQASNYLSSTASSLIYQTDDDGGSYPFDAVGNLVIQSRSDAGRDVVFANYISGNIDARMVVKGNTGNVGIGTTSPTLGKLQIYTSGTKAAVFEGVDSNGYNVWFKGTNAGFLMGQENNKGKIQGVNGDGNLVGDLLLNPTGGNVGIGTVTPTAKLQVTGDNGFLAEADDGSDWFKVDHGNVSFNAGGGSTRAGGIDLGARFNIAPVSDMYPTLAIRGYTGGISDIMRVSSASSTSGDYFIIKSTGNVGIGTTSPVGNLDVSFSGTAGVSISKQLTNDSTVISTYGTLGHLYFKPKSEYTIFQSTTSPNSTMQIESSTGYSQIRFYNSTGDNRIITNSGNLTLSPVGNTIISSGNVGIGTTTPGQLLSVSGIAADLTTSLVSITNNAGGAGSASIKFLTRNTTSGGPYTTGRIMSVFDGTTFADARISLQTPTASDIWVDALTAKNGKVGIGTTSPEDLLHVYGANPSYKLTDSSTGSFYIDADYSSGGVDRLWSDTNNLRIGTESAAKYIDFYTVNSQKVRITADGNVGIGTTTPTARLHLNNNSSTPGDLVFLLKQESISDNALIQMDRAAVSRRLMTMFSTSGVTNWAFGIPYNGGNASNDFSIGSGVAISDSKFLIQASTGNVGIGMTNPTFNLDLQGNNGIRITSSSDLPLRVISTDNASGIELSDPTHSFYIINGSNSFKIRDHTNSDLDRFTITSSGNVGIGTTNPTSTMHVIGSGKFALDANNFTRVGSDGIYFGRPTDGAELAYIKRSGGLENNNIEIGSRDSFVFLSNGTPTYSYSASVGHSLMAGNVGIGISNPSTILDINGVTTFRGNVLAGTDNSYDIGASGSMRPRTGYFGTSVVAPTFTATTSVSTVNATISGALTLTNPIQNYNAFTGWKVFDSIGTNLLAGKATKLKISFDGVDSPVSTYQQTTQNFEGSGNAIRGNDGDADHVIDVDLVTNGLYGTNGVTYASGKVVLSFYQYGPANITARVKDKNGTWTAMTMTRDNVYATSWTGIIPIQNYLTNLEFTISTGTGAPYVTGLTKWSLTQIEYYANRMTLAQGGLLTSIGGFLGGNMTIGKGVNVLLDDITGTKIGTGTTQKLGFWNATPIVQPANTVAIDTLLENTGLRAGGGYANFDDNVGIGTTTPGAKLDIGLAGTSLGTLRLAGNTSGYVQIQPAAAAGSWTMTLPGAVGSAGQQLTDVNGDGVTSWAAAGSLRSLKNIDSQIIDPSAALSQIVNTPIYNFHYKKGMGTGDSDTQYVGVMADEAAWAMHYDGNVINPVNTLGYMILGVKALDNKINLQNQNITETQSIASILGEQNSVETRLIASIEETINNQDLRISDSENKINELETQTQNLASLLQAQILKLEEMSNQELNFAWADLFASILNIDGNRVDILNIRDFSAEMTETGVMVIKVNESENATIGTAVICPVMKEVDENGQCSIEQIDANNDNMDDNTSSSISNGKSITVKTGAVKNSSKVFVTIKSKLTKEATLMVTEIKEGESFNVELVNPTDEDVTFDWWIVEMK